MRSLMKKLWKNEDGVTAVEYGLLAALISGAALVVITATGTNLSTVFQTVSTKLAIPG